MVWFYFAKQGEGASYQTLYFVFFALVLLGAFIMLFLRGPEDLREDRVSVTLVPTTQATEEDETRRASVAFSRSSADSIEPAPAHSKRARSFAGELRATWFLAKVGVFSGRSLPGKVGV